MMVVDKPRPKTMGDWHPNPEVYRVRAGPDFLADALIIVALVVKVHRVGCPLGLHTTGYASSLALLTSSGMPHASVPPSSARLARQRRRALGVQTTRTILRPPYLATRNPL